jgi:hypothetical protein
MAPSPTYNKVDASSSLRKQRSFSDFAGLRTRLDFAAIFLRFPLHARQWEVNKMLSVQDL